MLDPAVGQDVIGVMKQEIHRMELRLGEVTRQQEQLIKELERAISKRETITHRVRVVQTTLQTAPGGTRLSNAF